MTQQFSTNGVGWLCGSPERLALVSDGWGAIVIERPLITEVRYSMVPPLDIGGYGNSMRSYMQPQTSVALDVRVASGGEGLCVDEVPPDLRLADDMTVRQLLSVVYGKLQKNDNRARPHGTAVS